MSVGAQYPVHAELRGSFFVVVSPGELLLLSQSGYAAGCMPSFSTPRQE